MKIRFIVIALLVAACAHAETLVLRTGARVKGTIVFRNDEVVVFRDAEGARFQYPWSEVAEVISDEKAEKAEADDPASDESAAVTTAKKSSILLELAGGAAVIPNEAAGGAFGVDLLVGSHHIGNRHLFIGGGLGYHGLFIGAEKYNFLPVQVALRMPFTETKHAPVFGMAMGYGIALSKNYMGGIYASADLGYRCQLNPKTAIAVVAFAQFQQAKVQTVTTVTSDTGSYDFVTDAGRNLVVTGLKLCFYF